MDPDTLNFVIWRGATFRKRLTLCTDALGTTPWDLTGYTASLPIKDEPQGNVLLSLTTSNEGIALGGATGTIDLLVSATATAALTWTDAFYDLTITAGSGGDTTALLSGKFTVEGV